MNPLQSLLSGISLIAGTDREATVRDIRTGTELRGTNVWLLMCSAMLASIGLDTNSAAVIIGAMLVSPLMSPILGIGLGLAINDRLLMRSALTSFGAAVAISLALATLYFLMTPLGELTPELDARTTPTLLDVGVAFFGGVAGIVAGSRREKTSAIPGVAIATALMPPLCTAGYGLASGLPSVFFGALYLFFINAVCISLATLLIVQMLRFPHVELPDPILRNRLRRGIAVALVVILAPSAVILYDVVMQVRVQRQAERFVRAVADPDRRVVFRWELARDSGIYIPGRPRRTLTLYLAGEPTDAAARDSLDDAMASYGLERVALRVIQADPTEEHERLTADVTLRVLEAVRATAEEVQRRETPSDSATVVVPRFLADTTAHQAVLDELRVFEPRIAMLNFGLIAQRADSVRPHRQVPIVVVTPESAVRLPATAITQVEEFLRLRMGDAQARIVWAP